MNILLAKRAAAVIVLPAAFAALLLPALAGCGPEETADTETTTPPATTAAPTAATPPTDPTTATTPPGPATTAGAGKVVTTKTGLKYEEVKVGTGALAQAGKAVSVHYTGTLTDGTKFDSSRDRNQPFKFTIGAGQVIPGWDEGVAGMKVGGKRKLTIPAKLGYGARGAGGLIPPNATLLFDVELMDVSDGAGGAQPGGM